MKTRHLISTAASALALVAGLVAIPSADAAEHIRIQGSVTSVPEPGSTDPVTLTYTIYKPATASSSNPVPMVLHSHGWGGSRTNTAGAFNDFNNAGLAVLSFDQRGFGSSGGQAHIEDPDFEGQDVQRIVDAVAALDWVAKDGPGDPKLAAIGGSYGGGYQFVGAFTELRDRSGDTRFDALAPEITWWDLSESLAPEGVVRTTWVSALYAAGARDVPDEVHEAFAYGAATGQWPDGTVMGQDAQGAPVPDIEAFFKNNGPKWHVENGRQLDIPVLFGQGTSDNLFNLNQGLKNFQQALTPAARAESIFVAYNGGHALPEAVPLGTFEDGIGLGADACSKTLQGGSGSFRSLSIQFFQRVFADGDGRPAGVAPYHFTNSGNGSCITANSIDQVAQIPLLGTAVSTAGAGAPVNIPLVSGPITVTGVPTVDATVTSLGVDARAFFALSVGVSPADARVIQNNVMPLHELLPILQQGRTIELPGVAIDVPEGQDLYLTISPVSGMFAGHGSRTPGAFLLEDITVNLPTPS